MDYDLLDTSFLTFARKAELHRIYQILDIPIPEIDPFLKYLSCCFFEYAEQSFQLACINGNISLLKRFKEDGVDIHMHEELPLLLAVANENIDAVLFLISCGSNTNARSSMALRLARQNKDAKMIDLLLDRDTFEFIDRS